jgi:aspartyl-tRNA(Asn)/glutamyl-tRNA(Gln) amidotransferase subunit A
MSDLTSLTLAQARDRSHRKDITAVTVNMAGLPGIAVPAGLGAQGLPLGLQLIGRPFDEETLFTLGGVIEQAAGSFRPEPWW